MAANYQERILYGFQKIHVAKLNEEDGTYDTPVELLGGKSVEISFSADSTAVYADDKNVYTFNRIATGEGTLTVLGLTAKTLAC